MWVIAMSLLYQLLKSVGAKSNFRHFQSLEEQNADG